MTKLYTICYSKTSQQYATQGEENEDDNYPFNYFTWEALLIGYGGGVVMGFGGGHIMFMAAKAKMVYGNHSQSMEP